MPKLNSLGKCPRNVWACVQFSAFMATVKDMVSQVESEHRSKLEQLNSLQQENRSVRLHVL